MYELYSAAGGRLGWIVDVDVQRKIIGVMMLEHAIGVDDPADGRHEGENATWKRNGPRTKPSGTPEQTKCAGVEADPTLTICVRLEMQDPPAHPNKRRR